VTVHHSEIGRQVIILARKREIWCRSVIHGMVKRRPGEHQAVGEGDRDQASTPCSRALSIRLADEPWKKSCSPTRTWIVEITQGFLSTTKPTWQIKPPSRIEWIEARS
jgi:hypothetical protein